MAQRTALRTTFEARRVIEPIYTGGDISLSQDGKLLASCLGEDVLITNPQTGQRLERIEGVSPQTYKVDHAQAEAD